MKEKIKLTTKEEPLYEHTREENKKIDKLSWEEIINRVGKPVYDKKRKAWRVIDGYARIGNYFEVGFADKNKFLDYDDVELYLEEID